MPCFLLRSCQSSIPFSIGSFFHFSSWNILKPIPWIKNAQSKFQLIFFITLAHSLPLLLRFVPLPPFCLAYPWLGNFSPLFLMHAFQWTIILCVSLLPPPVLTIRVQKLLLVKSPVPIRFLVLCGNNSWIRIRRLQKSPPFTSYFLCSYRDSFEFNLQQKLI